MDDQIFRSVIVAAGEVAREDILGAICISLLRIQRRTRHMRNHTIATAHDVLCVSQRMLFRCGLWEPDITTIAIQVTAL